MAPGNSAPGAGTVPPQPGITARAGGGEAGTLLREGVELRRDGVLAMGLSANRQLTRGCGAAVGLPISRVS